MRFEGMCNLVKKIKMADILYWFWFNIMKIEQICENMFNADL
jgi:hypothetical protein